MNRTRLAILILFFFGLVKALFFARFGFRLLGDDMQNFTAAQRLLEGETIYKDYQAFFMPVPDHLTALLLRLANFDIVYVRYFYALVVSFSFPLLFLLTKKIAKPVWAFAIAASYIFLDGRIDLLFFHTFLIGSFLLVGKYLETKRDRILLTAGFLLMLGSFFRIDFALATFAGCAGVLALEEILRRKDWHSFTRSIILFSFFSLSVNAVILIWLIKSQLLLSMLWHLKAGVIAKGNYSPGLFAISRLLPQRISLSVGYQAASGWLFLFLGAITLLYLISFLRRLSWRRASQKQILIFGIFVQLLFSMYYLFQQFDLAHFVKGGVFFFPLLGAIISSVKNKLIRLLAISVLFGFLAIQLIVSFWFINFNNTAINFSKGGKVLINDKYLLGTTFPSADMIEESIAFLSQSNKDEKVFVAPYHSMLYFLSERGNPTIYDNFLESYLIDRYDESYVIQRLEESRVRFVIYDPEGDPIRKNKRPMKEYYPLINNYLVSNFKVEKQIGSWLLMKRINI